MKPTFVTLAKDSGASGLAAPEDVDFPVPPSFEQGRAAKLPNLTYVEAPLSAWQVWHFRHPKLAAGSTENDGVLVENLRCFPEAAHMPTTVCDRIFWRNVKVVVAGQEHILPLSRQYLITSLGVSGGRVGANAPAPWNGLDLNVDIGFDLVFRYRFDPMFRKFDPAPTEAADGVFDTSHQTAAEIAALRAALQDNAATSKLNVFYLRPHDIDVIVSLVCCKQAGQFTPNLPNIPIRDEVTDDASPVGVARFFPLTVVTSEFDIDLIDTSTELRRPAAAMGHPCDGEDLRANLPELFDARDRSLVKVSSGMETSYSVGMFADNNHPFGSGFGGIANEGLTGTGQVVAFDYAGLAPTWEKTFSHYHTNLPAQGEYMAVMPRRIRGAEVFTAGGDSVDAKRKVKKPVVSMGDSTDVEKWPGQGIFDNLHLAPRMVDQIAMARLGKNKHSDRGFDAVSMAPFCVHDCLHMHWRWSSWHPLFASVANWNKGWSAPESGQLAGKPYSTDGATMTPPNQMVTIKLISSQSSGAPNGLQYKARSFFPVRQSAQVFFHHGCAYSAFLPVAASLIAAAAQPRVEATDDPGIRVDTSYMAVPGGVPGALSPPAELHQTVPSEVNWARFYWHLRYQYDVRTHTVQERLQVSSWSALNEVPDLRASVLVSKVEKAMALSQKSAGNRRQPDAHVADTLVAQAPVVSIPPVGTGAPDSVFRRDATISCGPDAPALMPEHQH